MFQTKTMSSMTSLTWTSISNFLSNTPTMSERYSRCSTCSECWEESSSCSLLWASFLSVGYLPIYSTTACCPVYTKSRLPTIIHQQLFLWRRNRLPWCKCASVIYRIENVEPNISFHTDTRLQTEMNKSDSKREEVKTRQSPINNPADKSRDFDINHDNAVSAEEFDGELIDKVSTEISKRRLYSYRTKDILYSAFWCFKCSKSK